MSERKWTPGPWVAVFNEQTWGWATVRLGATRDIGWPTKATNLNHSDLIEREADAHLIAAAPELYEALERSVKAWTDDPDRMGPMIRQARAALAKARGEA